MTGSSDYPNLNEKAAAVLDVPPVAPPKESAARSPPNRCRAFASPSRSKRCAMRPIACWRRPARGRKCSWPISARSADFTARAMFAKNFYEAGGIEAVEQ